MEDSRPSAGASRQSSPRPRKALGQNFLRDGSYLPQLLAAAEVSAADDVLEIGAGTGVLTLALLDVARRVVAVELDDRLFDRLAERFTDHPALQLIHDNALALDCCGLFAGPYKVVANIPYYITGPLLRHLLEARCQASVLVLMVQWEVGQRLAAGPGDLSLLGLSAQYYAAVDVVVRVPAGAFYPRPKVDSAIVRLLPTRGPTGESAAFFHVARAGFAAKRKQLANSLAQGLNVDRQVAVDLLQAAGIDPTARAETVPVGAWERLATIWEAGETG